MVNQRQDLRPRLSGEQEEQLQGAGEDLAELLDIAKEMEEGGLPAGPIVQQLETIDRQRKFMLDRFGPRSKARRPNGLPR